MSAWRITLLGQFAIQREDGDPQPVAPSHPGLLLAYLAISAGRSASRDAICELLWPEADREEARGRLRTTLTRMRDLFGGDHPVLADRLELKLDLNLATVDLDEFRRACHGAKAGVGEERLARLLRAREIYSGCLLPQLTEEWIVAERRHTARQATTVLRDIAALYEELGNVESALEHWQRALQLDPLDESMIVLATECAERLVRPSEGLRFLQQARLAFRRELDTDLPSRLAAIETVLRSKNTVAPIERKTQLFGRDELLKHISEAVQAHSLVTLAGVGGAGKTTLAREVGRTLAGSFRDGWTFVDLADLTESDDLCRATLQVLELAERSDQGTCDRLIDVLSQQERLLVLDNCEHLLEASRDLVTRIRLGAPLVTLLTTSRLKLNLEDELVVEVPGLRAGDQSPAVDLFCERLARSIPGWKAGSTTLPLIRRTVELVDGLPLAIELAAARARVMPLDEIVRRLESSTELLRHPGFQARQQNLEKVIDWSIDRLSPEARELLLTLTPFAAGWSFQEAAIASQAPEMAVLDALEELVDASLVQRLEEESRFRLLETVKGRAKVRLEQQGRFDEMQDRHLLAYCLTAERLLPLLSTDREKEYLSELTIHRPNIRLALVWAAQRPSLGSEGLRLMAASYSHWNTYGPLSEGASLAAAILSHPSADAFPEHRAATQVGLGTMVWLAGGLEEGRHHLAEGAKFYEEVGDDLMVASCHRRIAGIAFVANDLPLADFHYKKAMEHAERADDPRSKGLCLNGLAIVAYGRCQYRHARELSGACVTLQRSFGSPTYEAQALILQADSSLRLGEIEASKRYLTQAIKITKDLNEGRTLSYAEHSLSEFYREAGQFEEAEKLISSVIESRKTHGDDVLTATSLSALASIQLLKGSPDALETIEAAFDMFDGRPLWADSYEGLGIRIRAHLQLASAESARRRLQEALEVLGEFQRDWGLADLKLAEAEILAREGHREEARAAAREATDLFARIEARPFLLHRIALDQIAA